MFIYYPTSPLRVEPSKVLDAHCVQASVVALIGAVVLTRPSEVRLVSSVLILVMSRLPSPTIVLIYVLSIKIPYV